MTRLPRRTRLAALALGAALVPALAACGEEDGSTDPAAGEPTSGSDPGTPAGSDTAEPAPGDGGEETGDGQGAGQTTVPVYFVGDTGAGPRLYREFRRVDGADPLAAATELMTSGDALDPDYRTAYPSGGFASVELREDGFHVELDGDAWTTPAALASSEDAPLAAEQLVRTLQGVAQQRVPVFVHLDGEPASLFGVETAEGLRPAADLDVLALVNLTAPEQGASVGDTFTASGVASSFEATVPWEVRRGDEVVLEGFATAEGWMDRLYPWEAEVDVSSLTPGEYTFVARTDDPSGGAEGHGPDEDTKTFTVR